MKERKKERKKEREKKRKRERKREITTANNRASTIERKTD